MKRRLVAGLGVGLLLAAIGGPAMAGPADAGGEGGPMMGPGYGGHMMGPGYGGHMMGPGYGGHMMGYGPQGAGPECGEGGTEWKPPTAEQTEQLTKLRQKFWEETQPLKQQIFSKRQELLGLYWQEPPDREAIDKLETEIFDLQQNLRAKHFAFRQEAAKIAPGPRGGYGPAWGRFPMGPAWGRHQMGPQWSCPGWSGPYARPGWGGHMMGCPGWGSQHMGPGWGGHMMGSPGCSGQMMGGPGPGGHMMGYGPGGHMMGPYGRGSGCAY